MSELSNFSQISRMLSQHGFTFSKKMGQHFLVDPNICPKMVRVSGIDENCGVIEIGPGIGVLTREIAKKANKVVAIELDNRLLPILGETLNEFDNAEIIHADALKVDFKEIIKSRFSDCRRVCVIANLPYYITSEIIMYLLESRFPIDDMTFMIQKEAAQRLCAEVGTRLSGSVTVAVRYYSVPKMMFDVPPTCFYPQPNVMSSVIKLDVLKQSKFIIYNEKIFFEIVRYGFMQRRKTLVNAVSAGLQIPKETVSEALLKAGIPQNARIEALTEEQLAGLSNLLYY